MVFELSHHSFLSPVLWGANSFSNFCEPCFQVFREIFFVLFKMFSSFTQLEGKREGNNIVQLYSYLFTLLSIISIWIIHNALSLHFIVLLNICSLLSISNTFSKVRKFFLLCFCILFFKRDFGLVYFFEKWPHFNVASAQRTSLRVKFFSLHILLIGSGSH